MTKSKTSTTSTGSQSSQYSNQFGWAEAPINAQMQRVIDDANAPAHADPSTMHRFAAAEEQLDRSYNDPFGAATSPDVREKAQRSGHLTLTRERDKAMREGEFEANQVKFGQRLAAAGLTQQQLINTGGTSSGSQQGHQDTTSRPSTFSMITQGIGAGAQVAAA